MHMLPELGVMPLVTTYIYKHSYYISIPTLPTNVQSNAAGLSKQKICNKIVLSHPASRQPGEKPANYVASDFFLCLHDRKTQSASLP